MFEGTLGFGPRTSRLTVYCSDRWAKHPSREVYTYIPYPHDWLHRNCTRKRNSTIRNILPIAGEEGLEPTIFGLTGRSYIPLKLSPQIIVPTLTSKHYFKTLMVTSKEVVHSGKDSNPRGDYSRQIWSLLPSTTWLPLCIGECYFPFFAFSLAIFLSVIYCMTGRYAISITQCKRLVIHTIQNQVNKKLYITKSVIGTNLLLISLVVNIIVSII